MKTQQPKEITFRNATFEDLEEIVAIKKIDNDSKFDKWFSFEYKISDDENVFFQSLIKKNKLFLASYNEEQLKAKFIIPILQKIDYFFDDIKDWYEYPISAEINGTLLKGKTDFMLAKGTFSPKIPYFFLQEFKRSFSDKNPEFQILAGMLAAIELNKSIQSQGVFVVGEDWYFIILQKLQAGNYEYFVSESFDCLKIQDLKQIYINLQAVKKLFCK